MDTLEHSHHHWNLHAVWDTALIETAMKMNFDNRRSKMEDALEALLKHHPEWAEQYSSCSRNRDGTNIRASGLNITCVIQWGQESWVDALTFAYTKNEPWENGSSRKAVEVADGDEISEDYYKTRIGIVVQRLIAAGVRLGLTLEDIFSVRDRVP